MTFFNHKDIIQDGDLVLVWIMRTNVRTVRVEKGDGAVNTRFGSFPFNSIIGLPYGSQVSSDTNKGFIYVLRPNPELWTLSLPHRTQIVYTPDSSYIIQRMNIRPGSVVIEAGTGSGSFSHAFARAVASEGRLFTYEFHKQRYDEAKREFEEHGMLAGPTTNADAGAGGMVNITHRDVCKDGFMIDPADKNTSTSIPSTGTSGLISIDAGAVFLDLPSPWDAIPHLLKQPQVVARNRILHICCFSPCIEQVSRTIDTLKENGFTKIEMVEVSARRWEAHQEMVKDVSEAIEKLRDIKRRRDLGLAYRNARIQAEREKDQAAAAAAASGDDVDGNEHADQELPSKKIKLDRDYEAEIKPEAQDKATRYNPWGKGGPRIKEGDERFQWTSVSRLEPEIKTHTSYLTFAILPPILPESA